ncbi:tripartite tricarboxylate transporter substrate binding protein [Noviherbaspirillum sedimenti]|uniref:Tripartite tricarboxylate transporter substrate binding protein n=1 Tax=Noviherbaspirillum sedimenti TaxID=2320865 RepID=A0A3A3G4A2_9BURK|nr:tripartite tricarboxylate transporter substrate binding protein [Noviherbaspirillum sedimenti]RJG03317.1 tripartite tricarboxylate transporter substrate binding protein [Noviherbaspirillum sedimenti]
MKSLPSPIRRALLLAAAGLLLPLQASAQAAWPARPIKIVVPFAPGGSNDNMARVLANKLSARLGQPVVVENKGGSGGTIGTDYVTKAQPDGYTLLFASTSITTNAAAGKKLPYDPVKDLAPIGMIATTPFAVVVSNDLKVTTLREFIDLARAKPGSISYGTAGVGGINHMGTELLAAEAKVKLIHAPYKGISLAFTDLMGGNLQMLLPSLAAATQHIHSGKMRGLAVTSAQRSPLAPELPTVAEAGLPGFQLEAWFGLFGPARLPADVVKRLNAELNAVLAMSDVKDVLAREAATPRPGTPAALGSLVQSELVRWTKLIKDNNIQAM